MAKITVLFLIIFLVALSLLAFFNKDSVSLTVWKDVTFEEVPVIALIFISTAVGIISMFIIATLKGVGRQVENWQIHHKQKKESKMMDSYSKGLEAFFAARYDDAEDLFTRVLESDAAHLHSLLRLGDIAFHQKDLRKAEDYYLKAKEVKPKSIEVLLSLEGVTETEEKWSESIKYLDSILDIDSENREILQKKRDIYEIENKWADVVEIHQKIMKGKLSEEAEKEESKKLLGYKYELARFYIKEGTNDKAIKNLKSIIKSDGSFSPAYISLSDAYGKDGNTKEAKAILIKGFEETSSLVFLVRLEDHYIAEGEPGAIIDIYQKAVQKNPKDLRLQFFLAKLYYRLEMIDYALDTINAIDPAAFDHPDLYALLGSVYERRSEYEKATGEFKKALNVDKPLLVPYCCSNCHFISNDWSGRCPECRSWNTFILDINEICKIQKRQSST